MIPLSLQGTNNTDFSTGMLTLALFLTHSVSVLIRKSRSPPRLHPFLDKGQDNAELVPSAIDAIVPYTHPLAPW